LPLLNAGAGRGTDAAIGPPARRAGFWGGRPGAPPGAAWRGPWRVPWGGLDAALLALALWLALATPVVIVGGPDDDLLYLRLARAILDGRWLGDFSQTTLARGPGFPLFLAACRLLRLPLNPACEAVYLAGCLLLSRHAGRLLRSRAAATWCLAPLALDPVPFSAGMAMVMREKLYLGLTMLALALLARLLPDPVPAPGRDQVPAPVPAPVPGPLPAALFGLVLGAFWLTREEGVWLLPAVLFVWAARLLACWRGHGRWGREAAMLALAVAGGLLVIAPVAALNARAYGVFRTNDFQSGPYPAALGALERVEHARWRRYVPVPREVRARVYAVSAAARELAPVLEGPLGGDWTALGCGASPIAPCDDLQGTWFMFALRDAVAAAGHYRSAPEADAFYRRLAGEIDAACADGRLACLPPRRGVLPPLRLADAAALARGFWRASVATAGLGGSAAEALPGGPPVAVPPDIAEEARAVLEGPVAPSASLAAAPARSLRGWLFRRGGAVTLSVACGAGAGASASELETREDPALARDLGRADGRALRFALVSRGAGAACRLVVARDGATLAETPLDGARPGVLLDRDDLTIFIDAAATRAPDAARAAADNLPRLAARALALAMRPFTLAAAPLALLGLAALALGRPPPGARAAAPLGLLLLLALLARLGVVALGQATTVAALEPRFIAPGAPVALALIGVVFAATAIWARDLAARVTGR